MMLLTKASLMEWHHSFLGIIKEIKIFKLFEGSNWTSWAIGYPGACKKITECFLEDSQCSASQSDGKKINHFKYYY